MISWLGPPAAWAGLGAGAVLIVSGGVLLLRGALALVARLDRYAELPLEREVSELEAKIARAEWRMQQVPDLIARARRALIAVRDSRAQVVALAESLTFAAQLARALFTPAPPTNDRRTPES